MWMVELYKHTIKGVTVVKSYVSGNVLNKLISFKIVAVVIPLYI